MRCFIALAWRVREDFPLILAANRDELYARPADPPGLLAASPPAIGGRDRQAGGTWLGVNARGLVVAITNREGGTVDPARPSRGLLTLRALEHRTAAEVRLWLEAELSRVPQNPFNLLYADRDAGWVTHASAEGGPETRALDPGLHLLTNEHELDALELPSAGRIDLAAPIEEVVGAFCQLLATRARPEAATHPPGTAAPTAR